MTKCNNCGKVHEYNNTGCYNSGNSNSGNRNSGDYNSGNRNSGNYNSGDRNSGYYNSGDYNSGDRNSGDSNSGNYNSGNFNSGMFNTDEPKMRLFNKESDITYSQFREDMIYPDLKICVWVGYEDLPLEEKSADTENMDGKLKILTYKEAWAEYWSRASNKDKQWFLTLPNFDANIFYEITGIKIDNKKDELLKKANELLLKAEELKQQAEHL